VVLGIEFIYLLNLHFLDLGTDAPEHLEKNCRVCGDRAIGFNFSVVSCESCKAFFRRNARRSKEYFRWVEKWSFSNVSCRCAFNENCAIRQNNRRHCKKCRLLKCFSVGMDATQLPPEDSTYVRGEDERKRCRRRRQRRSTNHSQESIDDDNHVVVVDDDHADDQVKLRRLREHNSESPAVAIQFDTRVPSSNGGGSAHSSDFQPTSSLSRLATTPIDVCVQTEAANTEARFVINKGWV
jgi:hypothetical protein